MLLNAMSCSEGYLIRDHGGAAPEITFWPLEDKWELIRASSVSRLLSFKVNNFVSLCDCSKNCKDCSVHFGLFLLVFDFDYFFKFDSAYIAILKESVF